MRKEQRYTEAQKRFLKLDQSIMTEEEKDALRKLLLPRKRYLPESDAQGHELAADMLGREKYEEFLALVKKIKYVFGAEGCWMRGDDLWELYYAIRMKDKTLCRIGISLDIFNLVLVFGRAECKKFELERDTYPRDEIQWTYDIARTEPKGKYMMFDTSSPITRRHLFRLLSYKMNPRRAVIKEDPEI